MLLGLMLFAIQGTAIDAPAEEARFVDGLMEQGWTLIPAYSGEHRGSLSERDRVRTTAAAHLFSAASELEPTRVRAHWSLGHAKVLLAENARTRGLAAVSEHALGAEAALSQALTIDPADPWCSYARGALRVGFGSIDGALVDLQRADEWTSARISEGSDDGNNAWLRFKAREWRSEALMQAGQFAKAREALREFHGEFSENTFPLHVALGECFLRERNFAAADSEYETIVELFPDDHQAYALRGYISGLLGDQAAATAHLKAALEREPVPGLYLRLWLWMLATDEAMAEIDEELREFLAYPPSSLSDWDRRLGAFCTGDEPTASFIDAANAEAARRMDASEPLDELLCEAWFYVGMRLERDAAAAETGAPANELLEKAMVAYAQALTARPVAWKWEWSFARHAYARLAAALGKTETKEPSATSEGGAPTATTLGIHLAGQKRSMAPTDAPPVPGQLWLGLRQQANGSSRFTYFPVLAR